MTALPGELFAGDVNPRDVDFLKELLPEVRDLILSRLLEKEGLARVD